ncbi:MAG: cell division protein FtsZ [Rickettsiales bacterium]|nr:cell division protein FtsZ [Rickettsiales bacterium]
MGLDIKAPESEILKPIITVFGVGGAGGNAVNNMIRAKLKGANFVVANTDAQALKISESENKIQLGLTSTKGLGAGASPDIGKNAAIESENEIRSHLEGSNMVFITAGMGGGTGTGASPVVAKIAKELGMLTVGVVTKPFLFEGAKRMKIAETGLLELQKYVDTLIVIPNQNLFRVANENTTFQEAFEMADDVLHAGVRGVTDLITSPGLVNLDFADIETVMGEKGKAMMGTGEASGEERAIKAAEAAIANPLLDQSSMFGAKGVLINITGGKDMTLYEVDSAANRIREEVGESEANIIFGSTFNPELEGKIRVSVVATGIEQDEHMKTSVSAPVMAGNFDQVSARFTEQESDSPNHFSEDLADHPPVFNEYSGSDSAGIREEQYDHDVPEQKVKMEIKTESNQINNYEIGKPKVSFLRRMWNSLNANEQQESKFSHEVPPAYQERSSSNIQEVPSFFKRDRE